MCFTKRANGAQPTQIATVIEKGLFPWQQLNKTWSVDGTLSFCAGQLTLFKPEGYSLTNVFMYHCNWYKKLN